MALSSGADVAQELHIVLPNGVTVLTRQVLSTGLLKMLSDV